MTEEGLSGDPMDAVEALAAVANMAIIVRHLFTGLLEQEFTEAQALELTHAYVHGTAGGKLQ